MGPDDACAKVVQQTGEVYFENDKLSRKYGHKFQAVAHRLGNVALISALREEASCLIGPESFVVQKILYSGTHSGDAIWLSDLPELSADLDSIRKTGKGSSQLQHFVSTFEELIETAKEESNPIVFV